ncbi:MAG: hypothetical protein QXH42_04600 [Thermoplasmata archaeon]
MPELKVEVHEDLLETIVEVWRMTRHHMSPEALKQLGWERLSAFAGDLLVLGFEAASEDPRQFILQMRERKSPIFKPVDSTDGRRRELEEVMRAYV